MKIRPPKMFQIQMSITAVLSLALIIFIAATEFRTSMARARAAWNILLLFILFSFCILSLIFNYIKICGESIKLNYLSLDFGVVIDVKKIKGIRKVKNAFDFFTFPFWGFHSYELLTTTQKYMIHIKDPKAFAKMLGVAYVDSQS